jgi:hypothetical protein
MLGRSFEAEDEGRPVALNGASYREVMPAEFRFPLFWQNEGRALDAAGHSAAAAQDRSGRSLRVFARRKPGVSLERASAAMSAIASRIERAYPETNTDRGARLIPLREVVVGPVRQGLVVLFGAVASCYRLHAQM